MSPQDPTSATTVTTYVLNWGSVVIAGGVAGMPWVSLVGGAVIGAFVVGMDETSTRRAGFFKIATSALVAGSMAHHLAPFIQERLGLAESPLMLCTFLIGGCWPWGLRSLHRAWGAVWDELSDRVRERIRRFFGG